MRFKEGGNWTSCLPLICPPGGKQPRTYQEFFNIMYRPLIRDIAQKIREQPIAKVNIRENLYFEGIRVVYYKRAPLGLDFILQLETDEQVQLTTMEFVRLVSTDDKL
jgi:hypothetical protein